MGAVTGISEVDHARLVLGALLNVNKQTYALGNLAPILDLPA